MRDSVCVKFMCRMRYMRSVVCVDSSMSGIWYVWNEVYTKKLFIKSCHFLIFCSIFFIEKRFTSSAL